MELCKRFTKPFQKILLKKESVYLKLLFSFFFIFLLPIVIGFLFFNRIETIMVHDANQTNTVMLEQMKEVLDKRFEEVEQFSLKISLHPKLEWLMEDLEPGNYKYIDFKKEIARLQTVGTLISDYFVYFDSVNVILTPTMKTNSEIFFKNIHPNRHMTFEEIQDSLRNYHLNDYYPYEEKITSTKQKNRILFMQSLPEGNRTNIKGTLGIFIDDQQIRALLNKMKWANSAAIYIFDENKNAIIYTNGGDQKYTQLKKLLSNEENGFSIHKINGEETIISQTVSERNDWSYVSVVPKDVVLSKVNQMKITAFFLVLIWLLIGLPASYYLANRNYKPIQDVVKTIIRVNKQARGGLNEIDFIKNAFVHALNEQKQLSHIVTTQAPVMKADFLTRIVKGNIGIHSISNRDLEMIGIQFEFDYYSVLVIQVDDYRQFTEGKHSESDWALLQFIIANISEEKLHGKVYTLELERDKLLLLVNHENASEQTKKDLISFITDLKDILVAKFNIIITISVSEIHEGMKEIPECYGEAVIALDYRFIKGQNSIILYEEIRDATVVDYDYHYPMETEIQLFNFAKSGDFENVEKTLNQIFKINIHSKQTTPEIAKCLSYDLLCTLFKLLSVLHTNEREKFLNVKDPFNITSTCSTVNEFQEIVTGLYREYCEKVNENQTDQAERLYNRIREYIEENYHDCMFSLKGMADYFDMNSSYLSSFFKKHSGQNLTDYITQIRVNESKKMLMTTKLTISEIAQKVGYANSVGLIRVFKKLEGIPPGKYRENLE